MTRAKGLEDMHCPDCHAPMRFDGYNRNGWWGAECGRRYSPSLGMWDYGGSASGCLRRQLDAEKKLTRRFKRALKRIANIAPTPGYDLSWKEAKEARRMAQRALGLPVED